MLLRLSLKKNEETEPNPAGPRRWLGRVGFAAFLFFLIKGLLWLLVPALLVGWRWLQS